MRRHGLKTVISNKGFIYFNHATLVIESDQDWYISVADDQDNEYQGQLELVLETDEGHSYLTKGNYRDHRITAVDSLHPLRVS
ncbi:hypothetical protein H1D32_22815 [Anaerobacillus sp. CMMVII]|uniref:hypothetical protein n=1 Tax=Anaerobacillus sp. CMMVII TaxID=2755588 RepID=UPI0021B817C8|nr:hypothetical protein [Anaerobacillus sp. CMMVII]MCT8140279.1 hypothetical protein [Anaerobacillus sp. CMMVII]